MRRYVIVLLALTCSLGAVSATPAARNTRICRAILVPLRGTTDKTAYGVKILKGPVACKTARSVLRSFLVTGTSPRGWLCFRGHASQHQTWAASCGRRNGALVRAYARPRPKPV